MYYLIVTLFVNTSFQQMQQDRIKGNEMLRPLGYEGCFRI